MTPGRVVSVNVGKPQPLDIAGETVPSGILKSPVAEGARLGLEGFEGDGQADRRVHGGPEQAAYAYPFEHYAHWKTFLGRDDLPWGFFGENLTIVGLDEASVAMGDLYRIGEAQVRVTKPRLPCRKLAARVGRPGFIAEFLDSRRLGFYLSVPKEGTIRPGDSIERIERSPDAITIDELVIALFDEAADVGLLERVAIAPHVSPKHLALVADRLASARAR